MPPPDDAPAVPRSFRGRPALVLGLGRHRGGVETVRFLAREGARVLVSDADLPERLSESIESVRDTGARTRFGPQTSDLLDEMGPDAGDGVVVASPAVPFDHPVLLEAERRGIPTTTEVCLLAARLSAPVLAVTGTKGKSTTAALLSGMVAATGRRTWFGGNVGRPLIGEAERIGPDDAVVLELSSFQCRWLARERFRPRVALVTNLFPDHLDRHGTMEHYAASKRSLLEFQTEDDVAVLPARDEALAAFGFEEAGRARRVRFGPEGPGFGPAAGDARSEGVVALPGGDLADARGRGGASLEGFLLWGRHNRGNAAAAAAAARAAGATWAEVRAGALAARPLRHRLEPVAEVEGVLFVDDSIATTPQSAAAALEAVPRRCVILVGGKDKGVSPAPLLDAVALRAKAVVGVGTTGPALVRAVRERRGPPAREGGGDLETAVRLAFSLAARGEAVLLSPGFSSLDEHPSFEARGDRFARAARALAGAAFASA
jgi:UDP-N-acetylmuramoylalanine--D-glutamate ligase